MKRIYVFTTKNCPMCDQLKGMLVDEKLSFFEKDVETYEEQYLPILQQSGLDLVPAVEIRDSTKEVSRYLVPDRDFKHLNACMQLIKEELKAV